MLFLRVYAYSLLLGGSMMALWLATWRRIPERWQVVAFCAAGGAAGAIVLIATLVMAELSSFATLRSWALPFIGRYALVGLGLGLVAVVTPEAVRHRVVLFCVTVAKQTWRYRVEVLLATLSGLLIQGGVVWLHSRLFPRPSIYVHANAPRNAARTLRLPDESQVVLAPGSQLSYTSWFTPHDERELSLTGEGTFAVARGARAALVLAARGIEVSASAARFTVRADETDSVAHVIVHEGLVRVRALTASGGGNALTLNAGEGVRVGPRLQVMRENWSVLFHR